MFPFTRRMTRLTEYGKKKLGFPHKGLSVWGKKIISGLWEILVPAGPAQKFSLIRALLWDVTVQTVVRDASAIDT
jgi:hypothetical protein